MKAVLQASTPQLDAAEEAIHRGARALLDMQAPDGCWNGALTADTTLESDFILLQLWLYPPQDGVWSPPNRDRIERAAESILDRQLPDGGFNIYPKGPADVSATVKAYFALKLAGIPASDPRMERARQTILASGGLQAANSYIKLNLSLFNLYPREHVPSVPPEMILLGRLIYEMSSWSRAIVIPLAIVEALSQGRPAPAGFHLNELLLPGVGLGIQRSPDQLCWRNFFLGVDRLLKIWERLGPKSIRATAIRRCEQWILERMQHADGLGAIYPAMMYSIMALDVLGYPPDHPERVRALERFDSLLVDDGERFYFHPCYSPVWDTGLALYALGQGRLGDPGALSRAVDWLLSKEIRRKGDWARKRPRTEPSGWCFEFANEHYPDIDDTAMALLALKYAQGSDPEAQASVMKRAAMWLLGMQSKDGGWAAFDADNNLQVLSQVPFADHNAMLDPTCPDITGRVIEALSEYGIPAEHPAIRKAVAYLEKSQEADGSWYGRWGVNHIYGTFLALRGLRAAGQSEREAHILRAGEWLRSIQNADGGWGESCQSYDTGEYVPAESTASQTSWALLGLMAAGDSESLSVKAGIKYLVRTQTQDGTWEEELATGTGFPRVFYLTYHLYRQYFPLLALTSFRKTQALENPSESMERL